MRTLNVGIIGWGRMGKIRAEATKNSKHNLIAVFDTDEHKLMDAKVMFPKIEVFTALNNIALPAIDVLFICSPPSYHFSHISLAIKNKLPFLVEKPLSVNGIGLVRLQKEINDKSVLNAVGYMNRYRPSIRYLKGSTFLGISSHWINKMYQVPWWGNLEESGGPLNEQATHLLDLNRYLMGEVETVYANSSRGSLNFPTTISITLKFQTGALGNILYSCDAKSKNIGINLFTVEEHINLTGWDFNLSNHTDSSLSALSQQEIFNLETASFFRAVIDNDPSLILSDINDAINTQFLVDAVNESLKNKTEIDVQKYVASAKEYT